MAEWLGSALQKLLQRFESASDLQQIRKASSKCLGLFCARNERTSSLDAESERTKKQQRAKREAGFSDRL